MAVSTAATTKPPKTSTKQHKRSRSGCFTCRLRRKKCDEVKPMCKACKNLGLRCEYKRPTWWGNSDQRRDQKEYIKDVIRRTQLAKKATQTGHSIPSVAPATPPGLCHSVSTPEGLSDSVHGSWCHSRSVSIDHSPMVTDPDYYVSPDNYFSIPPLPHAHYPVQSPYEIDIKVDRQVFINDVSSRRDSTLSSYGTFHQPSISDSDVSPNLSDNWIEQDYFESAKEGPVSDTWPLGITDPNGDYWPSTHEAVIEVEERDRPLLDYFLDNVSKFMYPVLDVTEHGTARTKVILPALEQNRSYLHCCLSIAAMHAKAAGISYFEDMEMEIMEQLTHTVKGLCDASHSDIDHEQILETNLAMMLFPSSVSKPSDTQLHIPWHKHFPMAQNLIEKLGLHELILHPNPFSPRFHTFAMTLTAWIDILGATMLGKSPNFAGTWRELNVAKRTIGLSGAMGCDDNVMYLISEIACLEERKNEGMDEVMLCQYIEILGTQISHGEPNSCTSIPATSPTGAVRPEQLVLNMTAVFRLAARIYLCSLIPGLAHDSTVMIDLIAAFTDAMLYIPSGVDGFDRSLAWPLLIAGSLSTADSTYRKMLAERCSALGDLADQGSLARVQDILSSVWATNDFVHEGSGLSIVHWREVMAQKQMQDCLLV